jgi:hypothetical protein
VRFKASASRCLASARRWSPPCVRWLPQIKELIDDSRRLLRETGAVVAAGGCPSDIWK